VRITRAGRNRDIGLGGADKVSLALARKKRDQVLDQLKNGLDPVEEKRPAREAERTAWEGKKVAKTFRDAIRCGDRRPRTRLEKALDQLRLVGEEPDQGREAPASPAGRRDRRPRDQGGRRAALDPDTPDLLTVEEAYAVGKGLMAWFREWKAAKAKASPKVVAIGSAKRRRR
jgi:hypothetical protein